MAHLATTQDQLDQRHDAVGEPVERPQRRKQWATRARTGCLGCRVRRVKCDEGRPKCRSCARRKTMCHYELTPAGTTSQNSFTNQHPTSPHGGTEGFHTLDRWQANRHSSLDALLETWASDDESPAEQQQKRWQLQQVLTAQPGPWYAEFPGLRSVPVWLIPPGWEAIEAAEWRNLFINKQAAEVDLAESRYRHRSYAEPYNPNNSIRIAGILCLRINRIAKIEQKPAHPTRLSLHLWIRLQELLSLAIRKLSSEITDIENVVQNRVLQQICDLSVIEIYLNFGGARAHFRAFLSILRFCGTPMTLARTRSGLDVAIHIIILAAVLSNTFTNCDANLHEVYEFGDQELLDIYCLTVCNQFPCPSFLWAQILKISRLRSTTAFGSCEGHVTQRIKRIFGQIASFNPASWQEAYAIPEGYVALLLASMFKAAVSIYCCASVSVSVTDPEYAAWSWSVISGQRSLLLGLLGEAVELGEKMSDATMWPLGVAGYAASKGTYSERALIRRILGGPEYKSNHIPHQLLRQLDRFWLHPGEGKWDDCWGDTLLFPI